MQFISTFAAIAAFVASSTEAHSLIAPSPSLYECQAGVASDTELCGNLLTAAQCVNFVKLDQSKPLCQWILKTTMATPNCGGTACAGQRTLGGSIKNMLRRQSGAPDASGSKTNAPMATEFGRSRRLLTHARKLEVRRYQRQLGAPDASGSKMNAPMATSNGSTGAGRTALDMFQHAITASDPNEHLFLLHAIADDMFLILIAACFCLLALMLMLTALIRLLLQKDQASYKTLPVIA